MKRPLAPLLLLLPLLVSAWPAWARGEAVQGPQIVGVRVGFAGAYKAGYWTPVEVLLRGGSQEVGVRVAVTVPDGDGVPSRVAQLPEQAVRLAPGATRSVELHVRFGRARGDLLVELYAGQELLDRKTWQAGTQDTAAVFPPALLADQPLFVTVGSAPAGVEDAVRLVPKEREEKAVVVRLDRFSQLPTRWCGYEAVRGVVLTTSDPSTTADLQACRQQLAALDEWVALGGKMVVCVGERGEELLRPPAPLASLVPGRFEKMIPLRQTAALETYCRSPAPIRAADGGQAVLRAPQLTEVRGAIEAQEGNLPLVVRQRRGFGYVVFLAADPDRDPLTTWEGRPFLLCRLLGLPVSEVEAFEDRGALMHYGFTDLAGQLRGALDSFPGVALVPFSLVVVLAAVYILLIGPADYFFLRKVLGRMSFTWITFPTIIVAVSLGAWLLAGRMKGDQVRVNQVDLIDVDLQSGRIRGTAWANLFSPQTERYDMAFRSRGPGGTPPRDARVLAAWLGLPGHALGGMNPRTAEPAAWNTSYELCDDLSRLSQVPIPVWSTKSLTARWTATAGPSLQVDLREEDELPVGTITNRLGFDLEKCLLVYRTWAYELGTLKRDVPEEMGPLRSRRELRTLLTGRKLVFDKPDDPKSKDKVRQEVTPYDRESLDVAYILRLMMFYQAADGRRYTGLSNGYQQFVDLSDLLEGRQAILVAQPAADADPSQQYRAELEMSVGGRPVENIAARRTIIYRFVLPVAEATSEQ